jgi:predicted Zn-dependent protease with MMP-like domain
MNSADRFDKIASEVWRGILRIVPAELQPHFTRIQIRIEDEPPPEVLEELEGTELAEYPDELCGLYLGTPVTEWRASDPALFPDRVYLFRHALVGLAEFDGSRAGLFRLREEIAITFLHEIGHFFGLEENDLERLGFD